VFRSIEPAWNDQNLRELAGHIRSHLFFAHIRAAIGSAVQQANCHPFRHGRWLFMHNGFIDGPSGSPRLTVRRAGPGGCQPVSSASFGDGGHNKSARRRLALEVAR
jgi:predicted glutamine amidotransferase